MESGRRVERKGDRGWREEGQRVERWGQRVEKWGQRVEGGRWREEGHRVEGGGTECREMETEGGEGGGGGT